MTEPISILVPQEVVNDTSVRVVSLAFTTGVQVSAGQPVAELETSKSNIQVEAPVAGWVQLLCKVGDDLPVGGLLGRLFESQAGLEAALRQPPATALPSETSADAPGITVFSAQARLLLEETGLDEKAFQGRAFVRAADVKALLRDEPSPAPAEPPGAAPAEVLATPSDAPFQQTSADGWPLWTLIRSDLHRIDGRHDNKEMLHHWWHNPAFRYVLWFRIAQWARQRTWAKLLVYPFASLALERCHLRTGIRIPLSVKAGPGLSLGHWGSMIISPGCSFGANCTLGNDINMGSAGGTGKRGAPQIGDNVFVGPGVRIAGPVNIGQESAIMANTLVTGEIPPHSIAIGVPHRISGRQETNVFVTHTNYPCP